MSTSSSPQRNGTGHNARDVDFTSAALQRRDGESSKESANGSPGSSGTKESSTQVGSRRHHSKSPSGFILHNRRGSSSSPDANTRTPPAKDRELKTLSFPRMSGESSLRGSPLSRELSIDNVPDYYDPRSARSPGMDPAQLVQMALDLSEGRRRHVSRVANPPAAIDTAKPKVRSVSGHYEERQSTPARSRESPRAMTNAASDIDSADAIGTQDLTHQNISPATLSRAEKARRYFELAAEHRRLLEHLPVRINDPKSTRGRRYNPLQALRNRQERLRSHQHLPVPPDAWSDVASVRQWVDQAAGEPNSVSKLPRFSKEDDDSLLASGKARGHRRTDTTGSVLTRPENRWSIEPTELLADLYWTERGSHSTAPEEAIDPRQSIENPRASEDTKSVVIDTAPSDVEELSKHTSKRRHLLSRKRQDSRRESVTSITSDDGRGRFSDNGEENIGPLARHMEMMISKHERGELSSPEFSPDHWGSLPTQIDRSEEPSHDSSHLQAPARSVHRRSISASGRPRAVTVESTMTSDEPSSPPHQPLFVPTATSKSKLHRLPMFSKHRENVEATDFAENRLSAPASRPRSSLEVARPAFLNRHRTADSWSGSPRRNNATPAPASATSSSGPKKLFKAGGRIGELVRNESSKFGERFRKDRSEEPKSSDSDDERAGESAEAPKRPKYHLANLPSFRSPATRKRQQTDSSVNDRQESELQVRRSVSDRVNRLSKIDSQRHWSISDAPQPSLPYRVSAKDIAHVRALLLSSGVKAHELQRRTHEGDEGHVEVASNVAREIETSLRSTEQTLQKFQHEIAHELTNRLETLQSRAAEELTKAVHEASEEADAYTVQLTTKQPMDVRQMDEAINGMLRRQRRQFRMLRRAGFKMLEWTMLGAMWWIWFIVVLFKMARGIVVGSWKFARWLVVF